MGDKTGRIYCILFVEKLTYDVSEMAAQKLQAHIKDADGMYLAD